jgi:hypothetical protein
MSEKRHPVPDWLVERLGRDDLPASEAARVRAALADEPQGNERLAALAASDKEILKALPPAVVAAEVKRRLARTGAGHKASSRSWTFAFSGLALGAAGLVAVFAGVLRPEGGTAPQPGLEETTVKGLKPQLIVYRKDGNEEDRLSSGTAVRPRDVVQLAYVAAGRRYGVIVSFDARGTITQHLPQVPGPAAALSPTGTVALPHAFELDDSPGFERFVMVLAKHPFDSADVVGSLVPGGPPLPKDFTSVELTLRKETP